MESLKVDLDSILEARVLVSETASIEPVEYIVWATLFSIATLPPPPQRERTKRHHIRYEEESEAQKKDHHEFEDGERASPID